MVRKLKQVNDQVVADPPLAAVLQLSARHASAGLVSTRADETGAPIDLIPNLIVKAVGANGPTKGNWAPDDPTKYIIDIPFGNLPKMNQKGGGMVTAPVEGVIAHEVGHAVVSMVDGQRSDGMEGENRVIEAYEDPIEVGTGNKARAPWNGRTWPGP